MAEKRAGVDGAESIKEAVRAQFGRTAAAYATSPLHARGADLDRLVELLDPSPEQRVLDVGTATGHTALRLASHVGQVVGVDMTAAMLEMARHLAAEQGVTNVRFALGDAEALPFDDASFDVVTCRLCAHHFAHVRRAVGEMARVVRPGGLVAVVDNYAPEEPALDRFINALETVRDPSHVREYTLAQWRRYYAEAGLTLVAEDLGEMEIAVDDWLARSATPPDGVTTVDQLLTTASPMARAAFSITLSPARFNLKRLILVGRR